jgi:hypothetical protein
MQVREENVFPGDKMDPLLQQASMLNSELGRFVRSCSFSSQLSGRFYKNNSMETHTAREQWITRMEAKRKKLERDVKAEDAKIKYLEKLLQIKEANQRASASLHIQSNAAARVIQSFIRMCQAKNNLELLKVERNITIYIALFLQSSYRKMKDVVRVNGLKSLKRQYVQESAAAIMIQNHSRCFMAKHRLIKMRKERQESIHSAASRIQALSRSSICRVAMNRERQKHIECQAATTIQAFYRGRCARRTIAMMRQQRQKKKPEKVSLYNRRYSTYSVRAIQSKIPRHQSKGAVILNYEDASASLSKSQKQRKTNNVRLGSKKLNLHNQNEINKTTPCFDSSAGKKENCQKEPTDQLFILAQQKANERVAALGVRIKQEKEKQQLEARMIQDKLRQLEQNRKGIASTFHSRRKKPISAQRAINLPEGIQSINLNDPANTDDLEFDEWVAENEGDID